MINQYKQVISVKQLWKEKVTTMINKIITMNCCKNKTNWTKEKKEKLE